MIVFVHFVGIARLGALFVQVRVRPLNKIELDLGNEEIWKVDAQDKSIQDMQKMQKYHYDATFGPDSRACAEDQLSRRVHSLRARELRCRDGHTPCSVDNQNIYDGVGCKITENVFQGRNGTLFAYGQTSAGARPVAHRPAVAPH